MNQPLKRRHHRLPHRIVGQLPDVMLLVLLLLVLVVVLGLDHESQHLDY